MATTALIAMAEIGGCAMTTSRTGQDWYLTIIRGNDRSHVLAEATTQEEAERNHLRALVLLSERRIRDPMRWAETIALERIGPDLPILTAP